MILFFLLDDISHVVNCFKEGKIIVAENAESYPLTNSDLVQRFSDKALFAVPILFRDRRPGVAILGWTGKFHSVSVDGLNKGREIADIPKIIPSVQIIIEREKVNRKRAVEFQHIIDELYRMSKIIKRL